MAYTPNEWACGDVIAANKLNSIERGIAEVNGEYVPTEWECGDVITADRMNHIEQGIANAGGGSSDLSTAQVTIIADSSDTTNDSLELSNVLWSDEGVILPVATVNAESTVYTVVLYRNHMLLNEDDIEVIKSTTGAIEEVEEGQYAITGDCSITVKQFSFS